MPPSRWSLEHQMLTDPYFDGNIRKLFTIRIRQVLIFAFLEICRNISVELDQMEDELYYFIWPPGQFLPSVSWEMFRQVQNPLSNYLLSLCQMLPLINPYIIAYK